MKKRLVAFLTLCSVLFSSASAATVQYSRTDGTVRVSGTSKPNECISVLVLKPASDLGTITTEDQLKEQTQTFWELKADDSGNFADNLTLGDKGGIFTIILSGEAVKDTMKVEVFSKEEIEAYLSKLEEAAKAGSDKVSQALAEERMRNVLGLDDLYQDENARKELVTLLAEQKEYTSIANLESITTLLANRLNCLKQFNGMINQVQVSDMLAKVYTILNRSTDPSYGAYQQLRNTDAVDLQMFQSKPYNSLTDITEMLTTALEDQPTSSGGNGGGGGGGKKGNSIYYTGSVAQTAAQPDNNDADEKPLFQDVGNEHWAFKSIAALAQKGIVSGKTADEFSPEDYVKREEFVKMLAMAMQIQIDQTTDDFIDTDKEQWYSKYLAAAKKSGLVSGREDGSFGVDEQLTRQDMAVMIMRAVSIKNIALNATQVLHFADADEISDYALNSVSVLAAAGVIRGTGNDLFSPNAFATRAQAAQIIYELMNLEGNI